MAIEARRGCGYRRCGGLYLCSDGMGMPCGRLPLPTDQPQTRQFRMHPLLDLLIPGEGVPCRLNPCHGFCPARFPPAIDPATPVGLSWVGKQFYTPESFGIEAQEVGVSKRIAAIPADLKLGQSWVFLAHSEAYTYDTCFKCGRSDPRSLCCDNEAGGHKFTGPGLFSAFVPHRIECLVEDDRLDEPWVKALLDQGVTIIEVPATDLDHSRGPQHWERRKGETDDRRTQRLHGVGRSRLQRHGR